MNDRQPRHRLIASVALVAAMAAPSTLATIADLEALQSANANLVFQYGFEGVDDTARLADSSGNGYTLQRTNGSAGGDVNDIQFMAGFEGSSQAYQPSFDLTSYQTGAGLNTISTAVPIAATVTFEVVLQLDTFVQPSDNASGAYILSAVPQPGGGRAYLFRQIADPDPRVTTTLGDTFGDAPTVFTPAADDWYYLAMVASYDSGANQSTVSWYNANLSLGETTLNLLGTDNTTFQGAWDGNAQVGVGNFLNGSQEFLQGRIDTLALTNAGLSQPDLQARLDAIYIPEPSTFGLMALAGGVLAIMRRRRG